MSRTDAFEIILEPMQAIYLAPREYAGDDEASKGALRNALDGYADVLKNFERDELHGARVAVFEAHDKRSWPLPSAFARAARKIAIDKKPRGSAGGGRVRAGEVDRQLAWAEWVGVRISPIATRAVAAECSWSLKCAILDGKRGESINLPELVAIHLRCAEMASNMEDGIAVYDWKRERLVVAVEPAKSVGRMLWRGVLIHEAETQEEIRRAHLRIGVEHERTAGYLPGLDTTDTLLADLRP